MRRLALLAALLALPGCPQLLGFEDPSESEFRDGSIPNSGLDSGTMFMDSGPPPFMDGGNPSGLCASAPSFGTVKNYSVASNPIWVATGDLNHDGVIDVVVANNNAGELDIFHGTGNGNLGPAQTEPVTAQSPCQPGSSSVAVGDFDGDGFKDLVYISGTGCPPKVVVRRQNPAMPGKFLAEQTLTSASGGGIASLTVADVNGDGKDDLYYFSDSSLQLYFGRSDLPGQFTSGFVEPISTAPMKGHGVPVIDLNGDGKLDVAWASNNGMQYKLQSPSAPGTFSPPMGLGAGTIMAIVLGDVSGDGLTDAILGGGTNAQLFVQDPANHLLMSAGTLNVHFPPDSLWLVDVNHDNRLDLVWQNQAQLSCSPGNFGNNAPTAQISNGLTGQIFYYDITGDGRVDALGLDSSNGFLAVAIQQ